MIKFILTLLFCIPATLQGQDADSILREVERRQKLVKSETVEIEMSLMKGGKQTRKRVLRSSTLVDQDDLTRSLIKFEYPPDLRGTGLLTIETKTQDVQKLFLPASKRVQRISSRKKRQSFVGSDFSFEDLGTRRPEEYLSSIVNESPDEIIISSKPKEKSEYGELIIRVDRDKMVITQIEYMSRESTLVKRFEAGNFEQLQKDCFRARLFIMYDLQRKRSTQMKVLSRDTNEILDPSYFNDRQLSR